MRGTRRERNDDQRRIIYSDLDATFLDHTTYSCEESLPVLRRALEQEVPTIFCSTKTRVEIQSLLNEWNLRLPFISENGGAVLVPTRYFSFPMDEYPVLDSYHRIVLGGLYSELVAHLRAIRKELGVKLRGFSDMSVEEVAVLCHLPLEKAALAKQREFDEPYEVLDERTEMQQTVAEAFAAKGLEVRQGGRLFHLTKSCDKGVAVRYLNKLFERQFPAMNLYTIGIGDSAVDLPMLEAVDYPALVKRPDGSYDPVVASALPDVVPARDIGPRGWARVVSPLLREI